MMSASAEPRVWPRRLSDSLTFAWNASSRGPAILDLLANGSVGERSPVLAARAGPITWPRPGLLHARGCRLFACVGATHSLVGFVQFVRVRDPIRRYRSVRIPGDGQDVRIPIWIEVR